MIKQLTGRVASAVRAFRHGSSTSSWFMGTGGSGKIDYRAKVGDKLDASVVMAPIQWVQRAVPEATLCVSKTSKEGEVAHVADHPMLQLIQKPNEHYADIALWWGTILSLLLDGNAYWIKVRNSYGKPVELWYTPHWMLEPKWPQDGSEFISHYNYTPGGGVEPSRLDPADVVHFRHGIDPRNSRKGISPIDSAIREIFMDNESSEFVSSLLSNMGVPGVVISPKAGAMPTADDVASIAAWFQQKFGGAGRGKPLVLGAPTDVNPYGFNPQQMNMGEARDIAEERVCSLIGIPTAVVGLGTGLQSTKVGATMKEMREQAWHNGVLPYCAIIADELQRSLLPDFGNPSGLETDWDTSDVPALQEDEEKKTARWDKRLASGAITVFEYRVALGMPADDSHRIYLRSYSMVEVPENGERPAQDPAPKSFGAKARASEASYKRGVAYAMVLQKQESGLQEAAYARLSGFFGDLGKDAAKAAKAALNGKAAKEADDAVVEAILAKLGIDKWQSELKKVYIAHYLEVATQSGDAAKAAGLEAKLSDPVAQAILAAGGRRAGLVDLDQQSREQMFDALAEGRAEGEGVDALAKRIGDYVEGGHWKSAETRARTIARTETKFAQNKSTIERAREAGVAKFIVFDGRLGPGRSKPDHIARDGSIVTADQADAMATAEHPNGTLSFAPHFEEF